MAKKVRVRVKLVAEEAPKSPDIGLTPEENEKFEREHPDKPVFDFENIEGLNDPRHLPGESVIPETPEPDITPVPPERFSALDVKPEYEFPDLPRPDSEPVPEKQRTEPNFSDFDSLVPDKSAESVVPGPGIDSPLEDPILKGSPTPEQAPIAPSIESESAPKTIEEVRNLEEQAKKIRSDMIVFLNSTDPENLSSEFQNRYRVFSEEFRFRMEIWRKEFDKLTEEQKDIYNKSLIPVAEEIPGAQEMTADQLSTQTLLKQLESKEDQLTVVNLVIDKYRRLDRQNIISLKIDGDMDEFKVKRRVLMTELADLKEQLTGEGIVTPDNVEVSREVGVEIDAPNKIEIFLAESKRKARNILRSSINTLSNKAGEINEKVKGLNAWNTLDRLKLLRETDGITAPKEELEVQEKKEKPGYGAIFKEKVQRAYQKARTELKRKTPEEFASSVMEEVFIPEEKPAEPRREMPETTPKTEETEKQTESIPEPEQNVESQTKSKSSEQLKKIRNEMFNRYRALGLATGGMWDYWQAGKYARKTRLTARDVKALASDIQKEGQVERLSESDALDEAEKIRAAVQSMGLEDTTGIDARNIEMLSSEITIRKVKENNALIDNVVLGTIQNLEERLKKYIKNTGEKVILTEEMKDKIADEIIQKLETLRESYVEMDAKEITEMLRRNLDSDWWRHIVYGGLESAAAFAIGGYVWHWALSSTPPPLPGAPLSNIAPGLPSIHAPAVEVVKETIGLKTTISAVAKKLCVEHGIAHPSNMQIVKVAAQLCKDSGVKVVSKAGAILWKETAGGALKDIALKKGFPVVISGAVKMISGAGFAAL